jgi:hypothetical protein
METVNMMPSRGDAQVLPCCGETCGVIHLQAVSDERFGNELSVMKT